MVRKKSHQPLKGRRPRMPLFVKKSRYSMRVMLTPRDEKSLDGTRIIENSDAENLGFLMECAFRNTIEDEGETRDQFTAEIIDTLSGRWGVYLYDASFCLIRDDRIVAATMITLWKGRPLLAQCMTHPDFQGQGFSKFLIQHSMNALLERSYEDLTVGVTAGNVSAENLYLKLGFQVL